MKIWTSKYHLYPKGSLNAKALGRDARLGSLLKIEFEEGLTGYCDCCPWVDFGDRPLVGQLDDLIHERPSPLMKRSLHFAKIDALARKENRALLASKVAIKNHYLITNIADLDLIQFYETYNQGYDRVKVKMGRDLLIETEMLKELLSQFKKGHLLRIDFNASLTENQFRHWLDQNIEDMGPYIEFIEDPIDYDEKVWSELQNEYSIQLALDLAANPLEVSCEGADIIVLKPAIQDAESIIESLRDKNKKYVITHYMDYPLGQMSALYEAQLLIEKNPDLFLESGLQARQTYEDSDFSQAISLKGPYISPPQGVGIGFDQLLEEISWDRLK